MVSGRATSDQQTEVTASSSASRLEAQVLAKGDVVGRYVVLSLLGSGGMGVVYAAYDPELDRKVALKLLHHEKAAPEGRRRLLREAQAMARLTHPAVVTVHDVGEHEGRVFIAMEYVDGVTMREWLRGSVRPWREVLSIYLRAGRGLVAAHALGLVHRDFKPDNVMITAVRSAPDAPIERVRVMDFGLARAFGPLTDRDPNREDADFRPRYDMLDSSVTLGIAGTPAYMAPEQKADADVDARADQFSFCVTVWEGIYGDKPFAMENLAELAVAQLAGRIEAPRKRGVPPRIRRTLERGLAAQPDQRFESMEALLAELEYDPSRRRALLGVAASGLVVTAGVAGWLVFDRSRAEAACEAEGAAIAEIWNDAARERVREGLVAANPKLGATTADLVVRSFDAYADAWQSARRQSCVATRIDERLDPVLAAAASTCLDEGSAHLAGLVDLLAEATGDDVWEATESASSLAPVERCNDEAWLRLRPAPPDDADAVQRIAEVRKDLQHGRPLSGTRPDEATKWLAATVERAEAVGWTPLVAEALLNYGVAVNGAGRHKEAEAIVLDAFLNALSAGDDAVAAEAAGVLTIIVGYFLGRHDEGLVWGRTGDTLSQRIGTVDMHIQARLLSAIGLVRLERGDYEAALDHHLRSRAIWEATVGPEHVEVARERTNAGLALWRLGRFPEATAELESALATWRTAVGPEHPEVALLLNNLGSVAMDMGEIDRAEDLFERALRMRAETIGTRHATYGSTLFNLGVLALQRGDGARALHYYEEARDVLSAALGDRHHRVGIAHGGVGAAHRALKDYARADEHLRRAIEIIEAALGPDDANLGVQLVTLGEVNKELGRTDEAKAQLERGLAVFEHALGSDHPQVAAPLYDLAGVAAAEHRYEDAVALLERALAIREGAGVVGVDLAATRFALATALHALGRDPERVRNLTRAARTGANEPLAADIEAFAAELDG
jgi:tetratricopeptide (TPR) repeat protein